MKNNKLKPYVQWFEFAEKTRNEKNTKADFKGYDRDTVFEEMIRKLSHKSLDEEDLNFIQYYQLLEGRKEVFKKDAFNEGEKTGLKKANQQIKQAENKAKQTQNNAILAMINNTDFSDETIANLLKVAVQRVVQLRKNAAYLLIN